MAERIVSRQLGSTSLADQDDERLVKMYYATTFCMFDVKFVPNHNSCFTNSPTDYLAHIFVDCPIYDSVSGALIGYKSCDDYVYQVSGTSTYLRRFNNTYLFLSGDWNYAFINNCYYYPVGAVAKSTCTGTGKYQFGGSVALTPNADGSRDVQCVLTTLA